MPLGKLSFSAYVISRKQSTNQQKQLRNNALHLKTSQSAKNQLNPTKNKNRPKKLYTPFLHESLQLQLPRPRFVLSHNAKGLQTVGRALIILSYTL